MPKFRTLPPLSLYIHLPWCVRKCPYCDFNSHTSPNTLPEEDYIAALLSDLDENSPAIQGRALTSIFFGGGTPSLFSAEGIEKILTGVHARVTVPADAEITLEANPGTVDEKRFAGFHRAGVNRLSIGIQSLANEKLSALGRIHDRDHALAAITAAINAGFTNLNLDIMHGLPNQSLQEALADVRDALQFQPPHFSWYQLTIEPNTVFYNKPPELPEEDILWDIQEKGKECIIAAGLDQYEVSAYAKRGRACVHNTNYWEFGDYLGIGAGAHSKLTDLNEQKIFRHWQVKNPKDYLDPEKKFTGNKTCLTESDIRFEFMLNALRLTQGVSVELFQARTGMKIESLEPVLAFARKKELLIADPDRLCATELGHRFLNDVTSLFLPDPDSCVIPR